MDTVLEQQRRLHEERERIEDGIMKEKMLKKNTVSPLNKGYCNTLWLRTCSC